MTPRPESSGSHPEQPAERQPAAAEPTKKAVKKTAAAAKAVAKKVTATKAAAAPKKTAAKVAPTGCQRPMITAASAMKPVPAETSRSKAPVEPTV